ncbi:MAG: Phosphatidate cytidylyltransferase (EC [uncultured Thiotrichaceae bacterium]|uniref:Phosphatidate cytidylyltransferase n=1 Tax=uncultured Thiotrichaceae bacterium TaxID=298394 RepID=A0A6S6UD25_9GAMM|nr:MAG: Phosphatidate cytidylyltransferase (EC [uncultured Thiotrichaceae bacterium]
MLKQRIITGIILAIVAGSAIYLLPTPKFAIVSLFAIVGMGAWEWATLTGTKEGLPQKLAPLPAMLIAYLLLLFGWPLLPVLFVSVIVWAVIIWMLFNYRQGTMLYQNQPYILKSLSLLVLVPAWYALVNLHGTHSGYVFYLISLIALADIGAYFAGKQFGKTKLAPQLSPGKTREGVIGGLAVTFVWSIIWAVYSTGSAPDALLFIVFSMLAVVISVMGDLFISLIKREVGADDSGTLLPGHGGVLDRIDSLLAAAPLFTLGLLWIKLGLL